MIAKHFFKVFIVSTICFSSFSIYADNETEDNSDENKNSIPKDRTSRPKAPNNKGIAFSVENGILSIEFRKPEGNARIEILDLTTGFSLTSEFDSAIGFRYALPPTPTSYKVTIRTEHGNVYVRNIDL